MPTPHDVALFTITAGTAVGALLLADAADAALHDIPDIRRRRAALLLPATRIPTWVRPMALHGASLVFLGAMATSGASLLGAFP